MTEQHWFQWERQATIQPILMCMEAWMEPIKKAYGRPWPTSVIIYNGDIVGWYNTWSDLLDYGQYLIDQFVKRENRRELEEDIIKQAKGLDGMFQRLDHVDLAKLSDSELGKIYEEIHQRWVNWFIPGGVVEPIGHQGEKLLQKRLQGSPNVAKIISTITTTTRESFSKRELQELLRITIAKKQGKYIQPLLTEHAEKYYWLHNNYFTVEVLDPEFFANELKIIESKYPHPEKQLQEMENEPTTVQKEKDRLMNELNFNAEERELVELLDLFAWYQDYRKGYTMQMLHYLERVLEEIGKRKGFTVKEMKYILAQEIPDVLAGKFDKQLVSDRMKHCLFYWDAKKEQLVHGVGQFSIEKEKEIFHSLKHEDDIVEVSGMVASKGNVRGRAYVTMSAKDATNIQKGDILITSMTTPDFVTAIKRAVAIVTNEGGILCHAAVVSREFGIPCIVGTTIATKVFKSGDLVEVDGDLGVVRKIKE